MALLPMTACITKASEVTVTQPVVTDWEPEVIDREPEETDWGEPVTLVERFYGKDPGYWSDETGILPPKAEILASNGPKGALRMSNAILEIFVRNNEEEIADRMGLSVDIACPLALSLLVKCGLTQRAEKLADGSWRYTDLPDDGYFYDLRSPRIYGLRLPVNFNPKTELPRLRTILNYMGVEAPPSDAIRIWILFFKREIAERLKIQLNDVERVALDMITRRGV
jgi:hypothetical protein